MSDEGGKKESKEAIISTLYEVLPRMSLIKFITDIEAFEQKLCVAFVSVPKQGSTETMVRAYFGTGEDVARAMEDMNAKKVFTPNGLHALTKYIGTNVIFTKPMIEEVREYISQRAKEFLRANNTVFLALENIEFVAPQKKKSGK